MTEQRINSSLAERYIRASRVTGPRIAASIPGICVSGYWVSEDLFFFSREHCDPESGRITPMPAVHDLQLNSSRDVLTVRELRDLLSSLLGPTLDTCPVPEVIYDMPAPTLLGITVAGVDCLVDLTSGRPVEIRPSLVGSALYSPDRRYACAVSGHDIILKDIRTGAERPLTTGGTELHAYGQQSETALSAVSYRNRPIPVGLWSPDSKWFFTHRIDDRMLPDLVLLQHAPPGGGRPVAHRFKYVVPNDRLATITYVAICAEDGRLIEFRDFPSPHICFSPFTFRIAWCGDSETAWFIRFDRFFRKAELVCLDLKAGIGRVVLAESLAHGYLNLHPLFSGAPNVRVLTRSQAIIWYSERNGAGHLYLYEMNTGRLIHQITRGDWLVRDLVHVDEEKQSILFLASGIDSDADPARRSLCSINMDGTGFRVLLACDGDVSVPKTHPSGLGHDRPFRPPYAPPGVSPGGRWLMARFGNASSGNITNIVDVGSARRMVISSAVPFPDSPIVRSVAELGDDGHTRLHGKLFLPSDFRESHRYPLIDFLYPGPSVLQQPQSFGTAGAAFAGALAEIGFVVLMVDTRNMPIGRKDLNQSGYGRLLEPQLADHACVVRELCQRYAFIDRNRVGVVGQSGGGAAAARAMFDYGGLFKVGISVCGNHDSTLYAAVWSDRYRGPGTTEDWVAQANQSAARKLQGKLLLITGDMDENVHPSHTLSLVDSLIRANRDFDLLVVPNCDHLLMQTSGYVQRRIWDYFVIHLLGQAPPAGFELKFEPHEIYRLIDTYMRETWHS